MFVAGLVLLGTAVLSVFGFVAFVWPPSSTIRLVPAAPAAFSRPMAPSCGDVFYCMNSTDSNPSYIAYATSDPSLPPGFPQWVNAGGVFDLSDPYKTTVLVSGVYSFVAFTPIITLGNTGEIAIMMIHGPGVLLATPVLSGDLSMLQNGNLTQVPTHAAQATAIVHLNAGDSVHMGYVVTADYVLVTPGAYWSGFLVRADE